MLERLQKILSARGIASRRKSEEYIAAGLVKVNGKVMKVGDKADPEADRIEVDGKVLEARQQMLYYVMHKPVGVETSNVESFGLRVTGSRNPQPVTRNRVTIRELLPKNLQGKIYPVGRLDKDSSGLLLLTNDGVLAYRLTHPKFDHEKEYEVTTVEPITEGQLRKIQTGVKIDGALTKPARTQRLGLNRFRISLTEGRNRQIRRMCQKVGSEVTTLRRVRIMTLHDGQLKEGQMRELTSHEKNTLLAAVGLSLI